MVELVARYRRVRQELSRQTGRTPLTDELARALGTNTRKLRAIRRASQALKCALHGPMDEDNPDPSQLVVDEDVDMPESALAEADVVRVLRECLQRLDRRCARILRLRFGLDGEAPLTLDEIGAEVGLTRERVRQLVDEACGELREPVSKALGMN